MNTRFSKLLVGAVFCAAPSLFAALPVQELTISDGNGNSFSIDQLGNIVGTTGTVALVAGNISVDGTGDISVSSNLSGNVVLGSGATAFTIKHATGEGLADTSFPQIQNQTSLDTDSTGAGTLTIQYTDTTYTNLPNALVLAGSESTSSIPGTTLTLTETGANGYAIPAGGAIGALGPLTGDASNSTETFLNAFNGPTASLTATAVIVFSGAGNYDTTFDTAESTVPEPTSVFLLGSLLVGLASIARKSYSSLISS
jgi:hypothetical protein